MATLRQLQCRLAHRHGYIKCTAHFLEAVPQAVDIISDILQNSLRAAPLRTNAMPSYVSSKRSTSSIAMPSLTKANYTADCMDLVSAGGADHGELVKATEKAFRTPPLSPNPNSLSRKAHPRPGVDAPRWRWRQSRLRIANNGLSAIKSPQQSAAWLYNALRS
ncbi:hypothetical protein BGY98DRAFT_935705 [Russula aff. rugulosa BPL654]|nr:hypothetical protein BGY98DRAFT_935705 [Russula aff. rugulosa BPL654]